MIELKAGKSLEVALREDAQDGDRVVISLQSQGCEVDLTPHQARVLATELIMAVNRAEVRNNLKQSQNIVRDAAPQKRGLFSQAFAK
jgi:hypothetical protein